MDDLISRNDALEIIQSMYPGIPRVPWLRKDWQERYKPYIRAEKAIRGLPSAQPDLSSYSDKLWKNAYERGKAEAVRKGKWIDGRCSQCGGEAYWKRGREVYGWREFALELTKYCPNCGASMGEGEQE